MTSPAVGRFPESLRLERVVMLELAPLRSTQTGMPTKTPFRPARLRRASRAEESKYGALLRSRVPYYPGHGNY